MKTRHRLALVTTELENIYQQRVMEGIFEQAAKYDYDVAVFSTMVDSTHFMKDNLRGEQNIFRLINFDLFDGVIVTPMTLFAGNDSAFQNAMLNLFREKCHCKVVSLDEEFGDYEIVRTDDESAFYKITKHIYEVHGCRKVYYLGDKEEEVPNQRLKGFLRYAKEHGIEVPAGYIFQGDFWYTSGEKLAEEIYSGAVEMPEAVICASDHMAIGLANRLRKHGIQVPEQILITGFDATREAAFNDVYISSYEPKVSEAAAEAVNRIHSVLEPETPCRKIGDSRKIGMRMGESCGCPTDFRYWKKKINSALLHQKHNWSEAENENKNDVCILLESYMSEGVTSASDSMDCIDKIYGYIYLLHPYGDFWLCLKENWTDMEDVMTEGYPEKMKTVIHSQGATDTQPAKSVGFCDEIGPRLFETKQMLPEFCEGSEEASVYYFLPVHAAEEMYGYTVMRCPLTQDNKIGYVYHNWIRIISNGLSMTRIRNRLFELSMKDSVTGLYNRRGLGEWLQKREGSNETVLVIMADMDGLKYINDHFGHADGDFSLISIADSLKEATGKNELSARIGGDEFLLVGVGSYDAESGCRKIEAIEETVLRKAKAAGKKYEITASLGYALGVMNEQFDIDELIEQADMNMYRNKRRKYKNRKQEE